VGTSVGQATGQAELAGSAAAGNRVAGPGARPHRDGTVGALLHGLAILDMFSQDRPVIGIAEVARALGVHRSTASRLAATLATAGYLEVTGEQGRYRLAAKLAVLGEIAVAGNDLPSIALPPLRELVSRLGETGHLGVLEGTEAVTVAVVDGWQTVRMHSWVGKRSPAHCSSLGKALLAGLGEQELLDRYPSARLPTKTPATISSRAGLLRCVAEVRELGYAEDREELEPHLYCVAAPLFGRDGSVVASVSVSGPVSRMREPAVIATVAAEVRATAREISARLGAPANVPGWDQGTLG
jgi:DNA-binding IclR family transcriptional regulator